MTTPRKTPGYPFPLAEGLSCPGCGYAITAIGPPCTATAANRLINES